MGEVKNSNGNILVVDFSHQLNFYQFRLPGSLKNITLKLAFEFQLPCN